MDILKRYRGQQQISQYEMADRLGVSQSLIGLIESGRREISTDMMRKLNALDPQAFPLPEWLIPCPDCTVKQQEVA